MIQVFPDVVMFIIQGYLRFETAGAFRGMASKFHPKSRWPLAERLLETTYCLNELKAREVLYRRACHRIFMMRRRERERMSDGSTDSEDESRTCATCLRFGGGGNYYNLTRGEVMCEPCLRMETPQPYIHSTF
jgi:hypothetical protein